MTTTALHEIETSEGDDGTMHPVEQLWAPGQDATENGFVAHRGLHITGLDDPTDDHLYPVAFLALGHHRWADIIEAAAAYMARVALSTSLDSSCSALRTALGPVGVRFRGRGRGSQDQPVGADRLARKGRGSARCRRPGGQVRTSTWAASAPSLLPAPGDHQLAFPLMAYLGCFPPDWVALRPFRVSLPSLRCAVPDPGGAPGSSGHEPGIGRYDTRHWRGRP